MLNNTCVCILDIIFVQCTNGEIVQKDAQTAVNTSRTLDLTTSLEVGPATNHATEDASSSHSTRSVLTIAFQFPFESNLQDNVANMARQYVRSVISSVQRVAMAISPSGLSPAVGPKLSPSSPEALTLAHWICQSYRQVLLEYLSYITWQLYGCLLHVEVAFCQMSITCSVWIIIFLFC